MLTFTGKLPPDADRVPDWAIALTAEERAKTRQHLQLPEGDRIAVCLPRGMELEDGDRLVSDTGEEVLCIVAKPEPVMTVTAPSEFDLLRAAYHLGNRHVPLEIKPWYLRLHPDPVLGDLLVQLGLNVKKEIAPFYPEKGAYGHSH